MHVELEKTGSYTRKISVTVPASEVDEAFDSVYREFAKGAQIPGFRPGKAPRGLIESRYRAQMQSEVQNRLVGNTLFRALQDKDINPVGMPKINAGDPSKKSEFAYSAEFEVQPEIELQKYKELEVALTPAEVDPKGIDEQLEQLRKQAVQLVPVLDRDTVQEGDAVLVDYEGTMGGVAFEGGKADNSMIDIGAEGYIPGFAEGLIGAKVPGTRQVAVTFPAEYGAKHLAGRDATFHFTLKELKKKDLPALDDDFAQDMGEDSLDSLKKKMHEQLVQRAEQEAKEGNRKALLESLVAANPFELPPTMVTEQTERIIRNAAQQMQSMLGRTFQLGAKEMDALRDDTRETAEFQVRSGLLLLEVGKAEGIEVTDDDVQAEIARIAQESGEQAPRVQALYTDPEQRNRLRYRLLDEKTVDFLFDVAKGAGGLKETAKKAAPAAAKAKKASAKVAAEDEATAAPKKRASKAAAKSTAKAKEDT